MKLLYCALCGEIRSLDPGGKETNCRCGNLTAWWTDPEKGTVKARADDRQNAFFIGLHNMFLTAIWMVRPIRDEQWRAITKEIAENFSGNTLFDASRRDCPVVMIRVGESSDITWDGPS